MAEEGWRLMVAASGKLTVLQQMLPRLLADGHRVIIFSQSVEASNSVRSVSSCSLLSPIFLVDLLCAPLARLAGFHTQSMCIQAAGVRA